MNTLADRLTARGSPFEIVQAVVEGVPCKTFRHAPRTLLDVYRRARACGDREFLVAGTRAVTYSEIFRMASRVSQAIHRTLGNAAGARIALVFDNGPEWIAAFVAVTSIGATAVAVHRASAPSDMSAAIDMTDCGLVICNEEAAAVMAGHVKGKPVVLIGPASSDDAEIQRELSFVDNDAVQPERIAMIAFTSGSTSQPKGVELTHRSMMCGMMNALLGGALAATRPAELRQNTKPLPPTPFLAAPFSHVSGYGAVLLSMYVGGKTVTLEKWDSRRAVELMVSRRATSLIGVTAEMLRELLRHEGVTELGDLVRSVVVQGTALPQSLLRELKSALPKVSIGTGYGLTETNGSVCMGSEAMLHERPNTLGRPLPTVDLQIRREDGGEAAPGEVGEVVIRGAMLMRGYANLPGATGRVLQDGWLRTGDMGWVDGDGFLYLADRAERFIVCDGTRVPCSAVERVVLDNKLAGEAFAFASAEIGREEGIIVVVSCPEGYDPDDSVIVDALRRAVHESMTPRIVWLRTSLPKTPSGKIDGRELRRRTLAQDWGVLE